ncbi:universal stress protein [Nocardiopsis xinjiangensis]|uniref:universal stress protein n=1 Tax=Nocardiopsis xinjiangensis TaxID=124285 RepID=UPI00034C21A7|nr:universal stress protein [Nocardiopsis xinjiangensis]
MAKNHEHTPRVVVGVDGSDHSRAALEWAAAEAVRRGAVLRIVHSLGMPLVVSAYGGPTRFQPTDEISGQATSVLTEARKHAVEQQPDAETETVTAMEEASLALIRQSRPHDLIVLGTRGLGSIAALFVGSVSVRVAAQAPCPVVVVPHEGNGHPATTSLDRVVVGVDSSYNARRALGLAVDMTAENEGDLVVVNSWEVPYPYDPVAMTAAGFQPQENVFEKQSEELVSELLSDVLEDRDDVNIEVRAVRTQSNPVDAVLRAAEDADAIVVGSRGRGTVRGLLLGSVSQGILHRSRVPVIVLPKHGDEDED